MKACADEVQCTLYSPRGIFVRLYRTFTTVPENALKVSRLNSPIVYVQI